jgi:integrase
MRGSTRKRGDTWTALWDATDPVTGKRHQKSRGGFARQRDAERFLSDTLAAVHAGTYIEPSKQPLGRFLLDEWLPGIRATVRPNTHKTYEHLMRVHVAKRAAGAVPLCSLNGGHLNALYAELEAARLSVNTRRLIHSTLHRALHDAVRWDKLTRNPVDNADPPSASRTRVQAWTAGELRRFLDQVRGDRLYALWRLAATTGMRRGELLGLSHQVLDLDGARLRVERQLKVDGSYGPPKSRRSERTIALDAETVDALRHHVEIQRLERDLAGPAYEDHDLVFCDELGRPLYPGTVSRTFVRHRTAAKVPVGSIHVLRHTAATIALTASPPVPLHVVAARLGDDPKTVLSTYSHLLPHSDAMAAAAVAAAILVDKPLTSEPATL